MKNVKYLSKQFKTLVIAGALALTSTSLGCGPSTKSVATQEQEMAVETEAVSSDVTTTPVDESQKYYNEIDGIEANVTKFINDSLAKGMFTTPLTEENKDALAKMYLNYYLMLNRNELSGMTFSVLNQDNDMIALGMTNDTMTAEQFIQEQAIISESGTQLDYESLLVNEADKKFIQDLATTVASMHTAVKNNDVNSLTTLANHVVEVKNSLIENNATMNLSYDPLTIDLALMLIDAADMLYNGEIIRDDEDLAQIFNTSFVRCIDGEYVSAMSDERILALAAEFEIEGYQTMTREQILEAISNLHHDNISEVSLRSNSRAISKSLMAEILINVKEGEYDTNYSYKSVIESISKGIDLSLQVIPQQTMAEVVNSNPNGANFYKGGDQTGKTTTKTVAPGQVPENKKVPTTTKTDYSDNQTTKDADNVKPSNESTDDYIRGKGAGISAGSVAASKQLKSTGVIPGKISASSAPSVGGSAEYVRGYKDGYASGWNSYVASAQRSRTADTKTYVPSNNNTETKVSETTPSQVQPAVTEAPSPTPATTETTYVPVDNEEEEIINETQTSSVGARREMLDELNNIKAELSKAYVIEEGLGKRM